MNVTSRSAKKTLSTIMAERGWSISDIKVQTGHRTLNSVGHYIGVHAHHAARQREKLINEMCAVRNVEN